MLVLPETSVRLIAKYDRPYLSESWMQLWILKIIFVNYAVFLNRNVLVESARIARGRIHDLEGLLAAEYDAVIFPGGFGAAKNLYENQMNILNLFIKICI